MSKRKTPPSAMEEKKAENFPALKNDLILRAATGKPTERVPIWCHRQAGRYLPEYHTIRAKGDFFTICRTPELACELTLQPIRRYPLDAAIIFSDILVVPQALGMECLMVPGKGPVFPDPLRKVEDLKRLKTSGEVNVDESLGYVFQALTKTRHALEGKVPLIGFSGAPWTLFAYMVEGGGAKSFNKARRWLYQHPAESKDVLTRLSDVIVVYLVGQVRAGAQMLEVFDSWAGDLSQEHFWVFAFPQLQRIAHEVKAQCRTAGLEPVPMTCFAKGAHYALDRLSKETEYDVFSLGWDMDPQACRAAVPSNTSLQGNLDPSCLYADDEVLRATTRTMIDGFGTQNYIANLGHGMLPDHDPDKLAVFIDEVHRYSEELNKKM